MHHPKDVGDRSTLAIMLALREQGWGVLLPFGENTRYDLVVDYGTRLSRVQCKTGRLRSGCVTFHTSSSYAHHTKTARRRPYHGEIDEFGVFCPELGSVYVIPITDLATRSAAALRIDPPKNAQVKNIRWAARYEVARIDLVTATREPGDPVGA